MLTGFILCYIFRHVHVLLSLKFFKDNFTSHVCVWKFLQIIIIERVSSAKISLHKYLRCHALNGDWVSDDVRTEPRKLPSTFMFEESTPGGVVQMRRLSNRLGTPTHTPNYGKWLFTRGQYWPSGIVVACVCPSVRPSVHNFVRAITHHPFKLGSPNLDHRCKRPWLRSLLFWEVIDLHLEGQI